MDTKQQEDYWIDCYLIGKMSEEEKNNFEQKLIANKQLREEVAIQAMIIDSIRSEGLKKMLQTKEREIRKTRVFRTIIGVTILAACILSFFLLLDNIKYRNYGDYYYSELSIPASRGNEIDSLFLDAYKNIGLEHYNVAIDIINNILDTLNTNSFDISTEEGLYLQKINNMQIDDAEWMKAIVYMKQGKKYKAKEVLFKIAKGKSIHNIFAKKIIDN